MPRNLLSLSCPHTVERPKVMLFLVAKRLIKPLIFLILGIVIAFAGIRAIGPDKLSVLFGAEPVTETDQIIESVTREEQVVLLGLGIVGISETVEEGSSFFGLFSIPASGRETIAKYSFTAKLGIEGGEIKVRQHNENSYTVTIPEFIFIGHSDVKMELSSEKNGILSFTTEKIDQFEVASKILGPEEMGDYIEEYEDVLRDQAEVFYTNIIRGIDPEVEIKFSFR